MSLPPAVPPPVAATVTATQVITDAFTTLNIYMPGDPIAPADLAAGLRFLNLMLGQWGQQNLTVPVEQRLQFPLLAGKGSIDNPYTIGTGGDLNATKPPNQAAVTGAGLVLTASTPTVEIPRAVFTTEGYNSIRIKNLTSTLFTGVLYLPQYSTGFGNIFLWPVPTDLTNLLVLYTRVGLNQFVDATTVYNIPDGVDGALYLNLIATTGFARAFGRAADDDLKQLARTSLSVLKRANMQIDDLANDFAWGGRSGLYNLQTGEG